MVDKEIARRMSRDDDGIPLEEQDLPDPFSKAPLTETTTKKESAVPCHGGGEPRVGHEKTSRGKEYYVCDVVWEPRIMTTRPYKLCTG